MLTICREKALERRESPGNCKHARAGAPSLHNTSLWKYVSILREGKGRYLHSLDPVEVQKPAESRRKIRPNSVILMLLKKKITNSLVPQRRKFQKLIRWKSLVNKMKNSKKGQEDAVAPTPALSSHQCFQTPWGSQASVSSAVNENTIL